MPLLGDASLQTLDKLLSSSRSGAVSVYDADKLPVLAEYYRAFGFTPTLVGETIRLDGGFEYISIPEEVMVDTICRLRDFTIIQIGLGKIYQWQPKK